MSIKIGVLLPHSKEYPNIGKDYMNGLKLALSEDECQFIVGGIGLGNDTKLVIGTIQKFIHQDDVSITTGILGHHGQNEIIDFVESMGEKMIYSDLGATRPTHNAKNGIYCNSLDLYQSVNHLANYFADNSINQIGMITSYYDAGYGFIEAMAEVFEQSETTNFAGHFITPLVPRENEAELMKDFVDKLNPGAIVGIYNGLYAKEHATFLVENNINQDIPYYTTQFTVGPNLLTEYSNVFQGTRVVSSWFPDLETLENIEFKKLYFEKYQKPVSDISLLGYENGLLIQEILLNTNLHNAPIGPRGSLEINLETSRTCFPHYLSELQLEKDELSQKKVAEWKANNARIKISPNNQERAGWHNAYLCY